MYPDLDKVAEEIPAPSSRSDPFAFLKLGAMVVVGVVLFFLFDLGSKPVAVDLVPAPWDKLAHGALFAFLAFIGGYSATILDLPRRQLLVATFIAAVLLGAADELHQLSLPGRHAGFDDLACDAAGALIGVLALRFSSLLKPRR